MSLNEAYHKNLERKYIYEGEIHKCPNCGEILESFSGRCPACGIELRGVKSSDSVQEFVLKLEAIEASREEESPRGILGGLLQKYRISKTDEQKISLIKNFSVPNTKEDILEFMILATSNIDMSIYSSLKMSDASEKAMTEAWNAKIKQVYAKAKNTCRLDSDFFQIQELYDSCYADIDKHKRKKTLKRVLLAVSIPLLCAIIVIPMKIFSSKDEEREIKRLEAIVDEVQDALEQKEYKLALNNAVSIDYQGKDTELDRQWDIKREYWADKVVEKAAKDGVVLEYESDSNSTKSKQNDSGNSTDLKAKIDNIMNGESSIVSKETLKQFIGDYEKADFDKFNSPADENGLGDSRIAIYCTLNKTEMSIANGTMSILGYASDDADNKWLVLLHTMPLVSESFFDSYIGEEVVLRGVYIGYSEVKRMPAVVLEEMMILDTGEIVEGMQKVLDSKE